LTRPAPGFARRTHHCHPAAPKPPGLFAVIGMWFVVYACISGIALKRHPWMPRGA